MTLETLERCERAVRDGLLSIISEVRCIAQSDKDMSADDFGKLMEGMRRFYPDDAAGDLISDAFYEVMKPHKREREEEEIAEHASYKADVRGDYHRSLINIRAAE